MSLASLSLPAVVQELMLGTACTSDVLAGCVGIDSVETTEMFWSH